MMKAPLAVIKVTIDNQTLGFLLEDGRFISVPIGFYPTLALATEEERKKFEINGSSVYWPDLDADIGSEGFWRGHQNTLSTRERPWNELCAGDDFQRALWRKSRWPPNSP